MIFKTGIVTSNIGLGGLVSKATKKLGVKPCGGCKKREAALDKMLKLVPYKEPQNGS